jgi:hypothetical protein
MKRKLVPGQKLWLVYGNYSRREPKYVTVQKVGRKWATLVELDYDRVNVETLQFEKGRWGDRCYLSREEHEAEVARNRALSALRVALGYWTQIHKDVTADDIFAAMRLLRLKVE